MDTFDFALRWPMHEVVCRAWGQSLEELARGRDSHVSRQSRFILQCLQDSGKTEYEIRDAIGRLRSLVEREQQQNNNTTTGSDAFYMERLRRVLSRIGKASTSFLDSSWMGAAAVHSSSGTGDVNEGEQRKVIFQDKKRPLSEPTGYGNPSRRRKTENLYYFVPPELMAMVISHSLEAEPKCAFDLVVPDWNICQDKVVKAGHKNLERMLNSSQVVTYTRGTDSEPGKFSSNFSRGYRDHLLTPFIDFDPNAIAVNAMFSSEYLKQFHRGNTHVFTLGTSDLAGEAANEVLDSSNWRDAMPLRGQKAKAVLPYDDEPVGATKTSAFLGSAPAYRNFRHIAVHSPLELMQINAESLAKSGQVTNLSSCEALDSALDLDRSAHLWLSWSQMPNLESVFLDLRVYSHDLNTDRRCVSKFQIISRAQEMGRHLQLGTLVLAGLQSYSFHTSYKTLTVTDIEEWDEIAGEPNWIKVFRSAVRPGGKIVLVDRLADDLT